MNGFTPWNDSRNTIRVNLLVEEDGLVERANTEKAFALFEAELSRVEDVLKRLRSTRISPYPHAKL